MMMRKQIIIILTKRAEIMKGRVDDIYFHLERNHGVKERLPNIILMVTAENQYWADKRIPWLLKTKAAVRGVSLEPLLSDIDLGRWLFSCNDCGEILGLTADHKIIFEEMITNEEFTEAIGLATHFCLYS